MVAVWVGVGPEKGHRSIIVSPDVGGGRRCCDSWRACNIVLKLLVKKGKERQKRNIPNARDKQRLKPWSLIDLPVCHLSPFIISPPLSNAVVGVQDLTHH